MTPILCARHDDALTLALELRGLLRPTLIADADLTPLYLARQSILTHATNFAGKASVEMLTTKACPLCFVNRENPKKMNLDGWIEHAADEALEADIARQDATIRA
jgi:hypothetical protein